jgi:hypothetical protein
MCAARLADCWRSCVTPLGLHAPAALIPAYPLNGRLDEQCRSTSFSVVNRVNTRPRRRPTQIALSYKTVEYCVSSAVGTDVHRSAPVQVVQGLHGEGALQ